MTPYKVLYIAPSVGIGGVETFLKHVSINHSESCTPYFLLFQKGPLGQWLEAQDVTVFYCNQRPRLSRPLSWLKYQLELFKLIKNHHIDIVHASMSYAALFSWPSYFTTKFLWFQHGPVSGSMDRIAYNLPHHGIIYNSLHTLKQQMTANSQENKKENDFILHLGTPAVNIDQRREFRIESLRQHKLHEDTVIISIACRLQRWKGVHLAISAVEAVQQKSKRPIALFIYGDSTWDEEYAKDLQHQARNLPIFFSEPIADVTPIFLSSDLVINSSTTPEPFGLTVIEAMSCGAAPIAGRHGGPQEILEADLNECLFEPSNPEDLAQTLLAFINDDHRLSLAKAKSFELFEQKFTLDNMIGHLESIYKKILP